MPRHKADRERSAAADTYAAGSYEALPNTSCRDSSSPSATAYAWVRDELLLNRDARQNLATFCTAKGTSQNTAADE